MDAFLNLIDVSYSYHSSEGETPALSHISFSVKEGEFVAIVGPSGCGKSTLLNLICGLLAPESGSITLKGNPVEKERERIGYMLQKDHLFEWRSIYRNVILGLEIRKTATAGSLAKADAMLEQYGLAPFRNAKPSELSGGMRQRAALIRTLVLEPELLLLDEPFSALDYQTRLNVCDDIATIIRQEQKTAILVTHDLSAPAAVPTGSLCSANGPPTSAPWCPSILRWNTARPLSAGAPRNSKNISTKSGRS